MSWLKARKQEMGEDCSCYQIIIMLLGKPRRTFVDVFQEKAHRYLLLHYVMAQTDQFSGGFVGSPTPVSAKKELPLLR